MSWRLPPDDYVSMNMWGAYPSLLSRRSGLSDFWKRLTGRKRSVGKPSRWLWWISFPREKRARVKVLRRGTGGSE